MDELFNDLIRYIGNDKLKTSLRWIDVLKKMNDDKGYAFLVYWRLISSKSNSPLVLLWKLRWHQIRNVRGIEIPYGTNIGSGILMLHPYNITINRAAIIGQNLTILKGATIGATKGACAGAPRIGNNVYIGLNATVVGDIEVGDDVLIAANSFVNFNVPSHSVVIGNPGVIHHKENAASDYITNPILHL